MRREACKRVGNRISGVTVGTDGQGSPHFRYYSRRMWHMLPTTDSLVSKDKSRNLVFDTAPQDLSIRSGRFFLSTIDSSFTFRVPNHSILQVKTITSISSALPLNFSTMKVFSLTTFLASTSLFMASLATPLASTPEIAGRQLGACVGGICAPGLCCSVWGYCGTGPEYCKTLNFPLNLNLLTIHQNH